MPTLSQYPRNIQIRAINRLLNKYGHDAVLTTSPGLPEPCRVLFGKYKISVAGGTLILNNNYKLHVRPIGKDKFDTQPDPTSEVTINGAVLNVVNARKIAPDGANPIVWEIEASGDAIPYDTVTIVVPSVFAPTDLTENYATTGNDGAGLYAVDMVSTTFDTTGGDDTLVGMDWEIATDNIFTTVVASVTAYTGGTTWNTGNVLSRDTNYWARVRHVGVASGTSAWSETVKFSLDAFYTAPTTHINQPNITTTKNGSDILQNENYSTGGKTAGTGANAGKFRCVMTLDAYSPVDAGAASKSHWQIATDVDFTTLVLDYDGEANGGSDDYTGAFYGDIGTLIMGYDLAAYPLLGATTYYARAKYVSVDPYDSEWSPTLMFKFS